MKIKKFLTLGIVFLILFTSLAGCDNEKGFYENPDNSVVSNGSDLERDLPEKILIYMGRVSYLDSTSNDVPILVIEDKEHRELFHNLIENAQQIEGILNIRKAPFFAEVQYGTHTISMCLYLNYPVGDIVIYSGLYIDHKDSHTGYEFQADDVEAFLQAYRAELYDLYMAFIENAFTTQTN